MFQKACRELGQTILPIVTASVNEEGGVAWGIGAGMIVNEEGWFITAGHILKGIDDLEKQVLKYRSGNIRKENRKKSRKKDRPKVTDYAVLFGQFQNTSMAEMKFEGNLDLGFGRLEGFVAPQDYKFPRFRNRDVEPGELFCRIGYPFLPDHVQVSWSKDKGFVFTNLFPVPMFVNEALVSRFVNLGAGRWIETSSPGLPGQSGGPLVDTDGFVCGIQVNTMHYPLFEGPGKNQVLNVGRAVHVETIRMALNDFNIEHHTGGMRDEGE